MCTNHVYERIGSEEVCTSCLHSVKIINEENTCCSAPAIYKDAYINVCHNCGLGTDLIPSVVDYEVEKSFFYRKMSCYKRMKYFKRKLGYINVDTLCDDKNISKVSKQVSKTADIIEIVHHLRKVHQRKFIKHVYEIYYLIHQKKLVHLSKKNKFDMEKLFLKFERELKKREIKYLNNYNEIIIHLMEKLGIQGSEFILKPTTFKKNENIYKNILSNLYI